MLKDQLTSKEGEAAKEQFLRRFGITRPERSGPEHYYRMYSKGTSSYLSEGLDDFGVFDSGRIAVSSFRFGFDAMHSPPGVCIPFDLKTIEAAAEGKERSADVIFMRHLPKVGFLIFVGDGVRAVGSPFPNLEPLLAKYNCSGNASERLIPELLRDSEFVEDKLDPWLKIVASPDEFLLYLSAQLGFFYEAECGISDRELSHVPNSQLPAIVGTAAIVTDSVVSIASIGDPVNKLIDRTGVCQNMLAVQNLGFDRLTREIITRVMKDKGIATVTEARQHPLVLEYLPESYDAKMNKSGGVSAVNAKTGSPLEITTATYFRSQIAQTILATDGLTLGAQDSDEPVFGLSKANGVLELAKFARSRVKSQKDGYHEEEGCAQEKETDDTTAVVVTETFNAETRPFDILTGRYRQVVCEDL